MNVFSLSWAAAGLALLGLSLFPAGSLALGGAPAHLAVFLLLLALAALALRLLRREGLDRPRSLDALLPIGLAFFLRALLLDYQSADYQMFLSQWAAAFRDGGGFAAVKLPIGNYNAPYLYFLAAISYLPIPDLYLIKLFSILFDVVLAWGGFRLVRHFAPESPNRPLLCFCLLLLLPTVILNGAFWGQCDALYGALTLHALACALERRNRSSLLLLGIAFSFKLQTVFVLPLWGGLWSLRRVRFRELLWFPAAYAATCVPALLLGKPLGDILGVYLGQAAEYSGYLNLNAPNMYALIPHGAEVNTAPAARLGILAAFALAAAVLAALLVFRRQANDRALLAAAVVLAIGVPFLLAPHA
ncbi:MAG: glycosyltransferase 87 family protein [Flavonifractor plautii]